jgi:L-ascorbate metabolism protein UlaG (beta-lactamase superfamily)
MPKLIPKTTRRRFLKRALAGAALLAGAGGSYSYATNTYYDGPVSDHFDGTRFFVPGQPALNSPIRLLQWQLGSNRTPWPEAAESPYHDTPPERVDRTALRVTLIGHASFLIQVAGLNILTDPVYSERASPVSFAGPRRVNKPGIDFDKLPPIDLVLISHGHYDHMDTETLARLHARNAPRIICPLGNDTVLRNAIGTDLPAQAFDWGQSFDAGNGVMIHIVPAYHWSARGMLDRRKTLWCSYVITSPAGTIYHIADTGYGDGAFFREAAAAFGPIKLANIPIGAYEPRWFMKGMHVNPAEAVQIMQDCAAQSAIGHHWYTFQLTDEGIDAPEQDLKAALTAVTLDPNRFQAFKPGQVWESGIT